MSDDYPSLTVDGIKWTQNEAVNQAVRDALGELMGKNANRKNNANRVADAGEPEGVRTHGFLWGDDDYEDADLGYNYGTHKTDSKGTTTTKSTSGSTGGYGTYSGSSYNGSGYTYSKQCYHAGGVLIATLSTGHRLHGAGRDGFDPFKADFVIDLAGNMSYNATSKFVMAASPQRFQQLNRHVQMPECLKLDWADYTVPPVGLEFWQEVLHLMDPDLKKVVVTCFGGHGRTGTAVAALMVADGWDAEKAISTIRMGYCEKAIETNAQEDYVLSLGVEYEDQLRRYALDNIVMEKVPA